MMAIAYYIFYIFIIHFIYRLYVRITYNTKLTPILLKMSIEIFEYKQI